MPQTQESSDSGRKQTKKRATNRRTSSFTAFSRDPTFVCRKMRWRGSKQRLFQNRPADRVAMHTQSQLTGRRCDRGTGREGIAVRKHTIIPTWSLGRPVTLRTQPPAGRMPRSRFTMHADRTRARETVDGIEHERSLIYIFHIQSVMSPMQLPVAKLQKGLGQRSRLGQL